MCTPICIEESQQFILSVLTSMSDIMIVCDRNGLIEGVNRSLVEFCGRDAAELRGRPICELFADELPHDLARERLGSFGQPAAHDCELPLTGSSGQMQQVVMNLVQNACDATTGRPDPLLDIRAERHGDCVRILFHDNGPGLVPDIADRLFDPFFTTKPVGMATGWGSRSATASSSATAGA